MEKMPQHPPPHEATYDVSGDHRRLGVWRCSSSVRPAKIDTSNKIY